MSQAPSTNLVSCIARQQLVLQRLSLGLALLTLVAADPVAAADGSKSVICQSSKLETAVEGFFQVTTTIGIIGALAVWQGSSLANIFRINREQRKALRQHKRKVAASAVTLLLLGPLATTAGPIMGLSLSKCLSLVQW